MPRGNDSRGLAKRLARAAATKNLDPLSPMMPRYYAQSKRMTKQAQTIAMDKVKKKRAVSADSKRKTGQAIDMLGKKKAAPSKAIPKGSRRQPPKPPQGSRTSSSKGNGGKPLQISPVGTSQTAGYSRTKPTTIPKGYSLMTYLSNPPKYKLVKNAGKNRGR